MTIAQQMEETKKAYKEIIELLNKYKDIIVYDVQELERASKCHLFGVELKEKYGFNLDPKKIKSLDWNNFGEYMSLGLFGEKYRRTVSWSDDGKQPEDEVLLCLGFPTGPYIFGDDYPQQLFQEFFQELKTYNPKYSDTSNRKLYFSMDNAGKIFNDFETILNKYYEKNREDFKRRRIEKLKEELQKLESN